MGIPPLFWGWKFWNFLHFVCICLDDNIQASASFLTLQGIAEFFRAFARLLPCGDCMNHFLKELHQDFNPETQKWPKNYFEWSVDVRKRVAVRVQRQIKTVAEVKPEFNIQWQQNAWNVLFIMGFNYPTVAMDVSFFSDVRLFFRQLPRLVPAAFVPELWNPILVRKGDGWCLSKTSFLETLFELRQAHAAKASLVGASSVEHMQQMWLQDLDAFATEYKRRQDLVEQTKAAEKQQEMEIQIKAQETEQRRLAEIAFQQQKEKEAAEKERLRRERKLIDIQTLIRQEKHAKRQLLLQQQQQQQQKSDIIVSVSPTQPVVPAKRTQPIIVEPTSLFADEENENEENKESASSSLLFEDDFTPYEIAPTSTNHETPSPSSGMQQPLHNTSSKKQHKKGFEFCFKGKDYVASYWIIWASLIVLTIFLIGIAAYSGFRTKTVLIPASMPSSQNASPSPVVAPAAE